jgi:hypothetical protein
MTSGIRPTVATIHRVRLVRGSERRRLGRGVQRPAAGVLTWGARVVVARVIERSECCLVGEKILTDQAVVSGRIRTR